MPPTVTAILVAADGPDHLRPTLDALVAATRAPDALIVAQLGHDAGTRRLIDSVRPTEHVSVGVRSGFGTAVAAAVAAAPRADDDGWLWLLASDNAPAPDALERLLAAVEVAPSVAIAGPKQMQWGAPGYIHSYGETMTRFGATVELAEPELDQAQYDRSSDVLAVAAGGMLVRTTLWRQLGGFDPGLPAVDDALDLCVRARLAGHRVQLVPTARVSSAGNDAAGTRILGSATTEALRARLVRQAQLHRRLVYSWLPLVPLHWLSILPSGVLRALGQLLRKRPGAAPAELVAAVVAMFTCFVAVAGARRRLRAVRSAPWSSIAPLRLSWTEVRHRRALQRDNGRPTRARVPLRFATGGGLTTVLSVGAMSVVLLWPLIGAPALAGGGLLPLGSFHSLWSSVGWGWHPLGEGFIGPADPFALVVALLGTLAFWNPSAAVVTLWLASLPIAALGGWLATARFTRRAGLRVAGALLWCGAPTLLVALDAGRIGAVIVHLATPFALLAAFRVRRSWTASAALGLLGALIAACAPSLLPALAIGWLIAVTAAATRPAPEQRARIARLLPLPLPTVVLFGPLIVEQALHGRLLGVLADPGPVLADPAQGHLIGLPDGVVRLLQLGTGWPAWLETQWMALAAPTGLGAAASVVLVLSLTLPLLLLAAAGLVAPRRSVPVRVAIAGVGGVVAAVVATRLQVSAAGSVPVTAWPGAGLSVAWLGLLEVAVGALDKLAAGGRMPHSGAAVARRVRQAAASVIAFAAVAAVIASVAPLLIATLLGTSSVRVNGGGTVPALVAAEAETAPLLGMLTITPQPDGGVRQRLSRGGGLTLEQLSTLQPTADFGEGRMLARLTAALVQPSGDDVGAVLNRLQIGYVLLTAGDDSAATARAMSSASSALGSSRLFQMVSATSAGTLYRFVDARPGDGGLAAAGPSNTATPIGLGVLGVQALVLGLTLLLALPTRRLAARVRPEAPTRAPDADVRATAKAMAAALRGGRPSEADGPPGAAATVVREPVGAIR